MAILEKACVRLVVAEIESGSAVVVGSGVTWAEVSGGVVLVAGGCGETELLRLSNLILYIYISLHQLPPFFEFHFLLFFGHRYQHKKFTCEI